MKASVRFRPALESDVPDLLCLIDSASRGLALRLWTTLREPDQATLEAARNRVRTHRTSPLYYGGFIIAEVDGAIAGAMTGRLIPIPYERGDSGDLPAVFVPLLELEAAAAGSWYITIMSVYPEFRGRGLGSALLGEAESTARRAAAPQMSLIVEEANARALKLYLRYGFVEWTRRPFIPFPGSTDTGDWILLSKQIAR
jgi:ribosomal protein S18 acetylase RimI-like enzyme